MKEMPLRERREQGYSRLRKNIVGAARCSIGPRINVVDSFTWNSFTFTSYVHIRAENT
jgi:hypothetical protein